MSEEVKAERGDLRMIFADAECVATPSMQREMGGDIWAHVGPIGEFTSHPELQDALGLVCLAFNRRHGRLSAEKHAELAKRDRGGEALLREALTRTPASCSPDVVADESTPLGRMRIFAAETNDYTIRAAQIRPEIRALLDALESMKREKEWQPIETAPKDGTSVLVCQLIGASSYSMKIARWSEAAERWAAKGGAIPLDDELPTYWMPLPAPPRAALTGTTAHGE